MIVEAMALTLALAAGDASGAAAAPAPAPAGPQATGATTPPEVLPEGTAPRRWYGAEVFAVDALSLGLLLTGSSAPRQLAVPTFLLAAPLIHAAHEDFATAGGSFLLRLGLPVVGGMLGGASCTTDDSDSEWFPCLGETLLGMVAGVVAASLIDGIVLSRTDGTSGTTWRLAAGGAVGSGPPAAALAAGALVEVAFESTRRPIRLSTELAFTPTSFVLDGAQTRVTEVALRSFPELALHSGPVSLYLGAAIGARSVSARADASSSSVQIAADEEDLLLEAGATVAATLEVLPGWTLGLRAMALRSDRDVRLSLGGPDEPVTPRNTLAAQLTVGWGSPASRRAD